MRQFIAELARTRTVVLFLDDLQWADLATLDMLHFIASALREMPVMILAAYRPSGVKKHNPAVNKIKAELKMRGICEDMPLRFLDCRFTQAFIDRYFQLRQPAGHRLPETFAAWLFSRGDGHPLFMNAMLDDCIVRGRIVPEGSLWTLTSDPSAWSPESIESVSGLIAGRIDELSEDDRDLLRAAAIHAGDFDAELLARSLQRDAVRVEKALDRLESDERIITISRGPAAAGAVQARAWRFTHTFYREQLLRCIGPAEVERLAGGVL
jgi:predicted ATPase